MIWKNLFRRKGRTFLTLAGIAIGVPAVIESGSGRVQSAALYRNLDRLHGCRSDFHRL